MNFLEAVKEMKKGKEGFCDWDASTWKLIGGVFYLREEDENPANREFKQHSLSLLNIQSNWEVVEEKKTLSDKFRIFNQNGDMAVSKEDVKQHLKEFIDYLKEEDVVEKNIVLRLEKAKKIFGEPLI